LLPREKWAAAGVEWTHIPPDPARLPVSQPFHFSSLQLKGISTVWISKRERDKKEVFENQMEKN